MIYSNKNKTATTKTDWAEVAKFVRFNSNDHQILIPHPDTLIWRYFSYSWFKDLIDSQLLYCPLISAFSDFREGTLTNRAARDSHASVRHFKFNENGDGFDELPVTQSDRDFVTGLVGFAGQTITGNNIFANCWNADELESNLMWRAYGTVGADDGQNFKVAIKSSCRKLVDALTTDGYDGEFYLGKLNYLNFDAEPGDPGILRLAFQKRLEYMSENEIRLVYFDPNNSDIRKLSRERKIEHIKLPIDLNTLIDEVRVEACKVDPLMMATDENYKVEIEQAVENRCRLVAADLNRAGINEKALSMSLIL